MENRSDNVAPVDYLIRCGHHDVLADPQVTQQTAYLDSGPSFVRNVTHHDEQVYVTDITGITPCPGTKEQDA